MTRQIDWPRAVLSFLAGFGVAVTGRSPEQLTWQSVVWAVASGLVTMGAFVLDPMKSPGAARKEAETDEAGNPGGN